MNDSETFDVERIHDQGKQLAIAPEGMGLMKLKLIPHVQRNHSHRGCGLAAAGSL